MVEWTDEAIKEALHALDGWSSNNFEAMRDALDAAVKAQEIDKTALNVVLGYEAGVEQGRAEAFEEAAKVLDARHFYYQQLALQRGLDTNSDYCHADQLAKEDANTIRALTKEPPK